MTWILIVAVAVSFGLAAIALYISCVVEKSRRGKRRVGYQREDMQIDPANVPEFKPTWQDTR